MNQLHFASNTIEVPANNDMQPLLPASYSKKQLFSCLLNGSFDEIIGALVIRAGPECDVTVDGLSVQNKGWDLEELPEDADVAETVAIRGYTMTKHESTEILITGNLAKYVVGKDVLVEKLE